MYAMYCAVRLYRDRNQNPAQPEQKKVNLNLSSFGADIQPRTSVNNVEIE